MACSREREHSANRVVDFHQSSVGSGRVIKGNEVPNFVKIVEGIRMENKTAHESRRFSLFWRS
jgi:hypothetical protein